MELTILSIMLAVITALSFSACSTNVTTESEPEATQAQETTQVQETTIEETTAVETPTVAEIEKTSEKNTKAAAPKAAAGYKTLYSSLLKSKGYKYFELIYVDEDDIPELVCFNGYAHADRTALYTVYNGKLSKVGKYGMYGSMAYAEKKNRIFGYMGVEENDKLSAKYTYMIQNGSAVKAPDYKGYKSKLAGNDGSYYKNNDTNRKKLLS